jgi:hypothetical protein
MTTYELPMDLMHVCSELDEWTRRRADALAAELRADAELDELHALTALDVRRRLEREGDRRPTQDQIDDEVFANEDYVIARQRAIEAQIERFRAEARLEALQARKDVLLATAYP